METDARLIGRAVAGESAAFGEVLQRHQLPVYSYLVRRAGTQAAEDLLSDVWIAAYRARFSFDARWESARPWLFGIARNILKSHWKNQDHYRHGPEETLDPWPEVDMRLTASTLAKDLSAAILDLPPIQREVLLLVAWEELTPAEVASVLGIPPSTARSHLRRARKSLMSETVIVDERERT